MERRRRWREEEEGKEEKVDEEEGEEEKVEEEEGKGEEFQGMNGM